MMIHADDAPSLENSLHRALQKHRIDKVNLRKEFFKTTVEIIHQIAQQHRADVQYVADPEALEYRQSRDMTEEDAAEIEGVVESIYGGDDEDEKTVSDEH